MTEERYSWAHATKTNVPPSWTEMVIRQVAAETRLLVDLAVKGRGHMMRAGRLGRETKRTLVGWPWLAPNLDSHGLEWTVNRVRALATDAAHEARQAMVVAARLRWHQLVKRNGDEPISPREDPFSWSILEEGESATAAAERHGVKRS